MFNANVICLCVHARARAWLPLALLQPSQGRSLVAAGTLEVTFTSCLFMTASFLFCPAGADLRFWVSADGFWGVRLMF